MGFRVADEGGDVVVGEEGVGEDLWPGEAGEMGQRPPARNLGGGSIRETYGRESMP